MIVYYTKEKIMKPLKAGQKGKNEFKEIYKTQLRFVDLTRCQIQES